MTFRLGFNGESVTFAYFGDHFPSFPVLAVCLASSKLISRAKSSKGCLPLHLLSEISNTLVIFSCALSFDLQRQCPRYRKTIAFPFVLLPEYFHIFLLRLDPSHVGQSFSRSNARPILCLKLFLENAEKVFSTRTYSALSLLRASHFAVSVHRGLKNIHLKL